MAAQAALDSVAVRQLAAEDSGDKVAAIRQLVQTADPDAVRVLKAMAEDSLFVAGDQVVIIEGEHDSDCGPGCPRGSRQGSAGPGEGSGARSCCARARRPGSCSARGGPRRAATPGAG